MSSNQESSTQDNSNPPSNSQVLLRSLLNRGRVNQNMINLLISFQDDYPNVHSDDEFSSTSEDEYHPIDHTPIEKDSSSLLSDIESMADLMKLPAITYGKSVFTKMERTHDFAANYWFTETLLEKFLQYQDDWNELTKFINTIPSPQVLQKFLQSSTTLNHKELFLMKVLIHILTIYYQINDDPQMNTYKTVLKLAQSFFGCLNTSNFKDFDQGTKKLWENLNPPEEWKFIFHYERPHKKECIEYYNLQLENVCIQTNGQGFYTPMI